MKKIKAFLAALLLSITGITSLNVGQALAATCTWTGATNDNFNTSSNWSGCGSAVPQTGDSVTFNVSSLSADKILNNDITSLSVATITFTGSNASGYVYKFTGNNLTITGGITANAPAILDLPITLGAAQTWGGTASYLYLGSSSNTRALATATYNLTLNLDSVYMYAALTGSGNIIANKSLTMFKSSPAWTGTTSIAATGDVFISKADSLGPTGAVAVASGGSLVFCGPNGFTVQNPITVGGTNGGFGALASASGCGSGGGGSTGSNPAADVTLAGAVTLTADTLVSSGGIMKITGPLSGAFALSFRGGDEGSLVIASSNNTSKTPNGSVVAAAETITIEAGDNQDSVGVTVGYNQTYVIDGVRGTVNVSSGGTLKGTGTVGDTTIYGHIAPGKSPGCLNTGALSFQTGSTYDFELAGTTACSQYDQLKATGTVTFIGGNISVALLDGFKPAKGQVYTIVDNDGSDAVSGTFTNLAEGATFTANGYVYKISYVGGSGNDITLTVMNVPSTPDTGFAVIQANPVASAMAMVAAGGALLFVANRSKHTKASRTRRR